MQWRWYFRIIPKDILHWRIEYVPKSHRWALFCRFWHHPLLSDRHDFPHKISVAIYHLNKIAITLAKGHVVIESRESVLCIVYRVVETPESQIFVFWTTNQFILDDSQSSDRIHVRRLKRGQYLHVCHVHSPYMMIPRPVV